MIGTVLTNRYELMERVGIGGMAVVYKAKCRLLNRIVAVKVLRDEFQNDAEFIRRFDVEAKAAASLSHPNIVSIYDVGHDAGVHYIVMEYIEGSTLKEYMSKKGLLYWKEALNFAMQICGALDHAHSKNVIHRDIKPHNIMLNTDGIIKVTDFGIARAVSSSSTTISGESAIGSAHYLSPEQARGGYTDERSDIYSLGVMMYEMLAGVLPFDGDTPIAVAMQHIQSIPVPPSNFKPDIPKGAERIILKALNKEQRMRYSSATLMLADIRKVYADPEADIDVAGSDDVFTTRRIQISNNDFDQVDDHSHKRKKAKSKRRIKQADRIAITAAIITSVVIMCFFGVVFAKLFWPTGEVNAEILVPNIVDKELEAAKNSLDPDQFTIEVIQNRNDSTIAAGRIISQDPPADKSVKTPRTIQVVVSLGFATVELKDYTGTDYKVAQLDLEQRNILCDIKREHSEDTPIDRVISQLPIRGTQVKTGDTVTLYVSLGREITLVKVPDLKDCTEAEAKRRLEEVNLVLGEVEEDYSNAEAGRVIRQMVAKDTEIEMKKPVGIVISKGSQASSAPIVTTLPTPSANPDSSAGNSAEPFTRLIVVPPDKQSMRVEVRVDGSTVYNRVHTRGESAMESSVTVDAQSDSLIEVFYDEEKVHSEDRGS